MNAPVRDAVPLAPRTHSVQRPAPTPGVPQRATVLAALCVLGAIAWWVYQPAVRRPFDLMDFPYTLPLLQSNPTFDARVRAFTAEYLLHGRFNYLSYALISGQWELFGWWTPGWQLTRFATMSGIVVVSYHLLRAFSLPRMASLAGASVFLFAPPAAMAMTRLTTAEPLGTLLILAACWIGAGLSRAERGTAYHARAALIAVLLCGAALTKEMLLAAAPMPYLCALAVLPKGAVSDTRTYRWLLPALSIGAIALCVTLIPIIEAFLQAPPTAYGARYGSMAVSALDLFGSFALSTIPFLPAGAKTALPGLLAAIGYLLLLTVGLTAFHRERPIGEPARRLTLLAFLFPLLGTLAYAPWPSYLIFYSLPFLFGGALLIAVALTGCASLSRTASGAAWAVMGFALFMGLTQAIDEARTTGSLQVAVGRLIPLIEAMPRVDTVLFAARVAPGDSRGLLGERLAAYAAAAGHRWPPVRDVPCEELANIRHGQDSGARLVVLHLSTLCPTPAAATIADSIRVTYHHFDWARLGVYADSLRVDVVTSSSP